MIGALKNRIQLMTPTLIADGGGGGAVVWLPGPELWAEVERLAAAFDASGDRRARLQRIAATIRKRNDIVLGHRLAFGAEIFEVVSVEDDASGRRMVLVCEEAGS